MQHILYNLFLDDCIQNLEEKYKEIIINDLDKTFLYSNIIELSTYYKLFSSKENNDYKIHQKLHNNKQIETINLLKKEIIENNYNSETILFLYGYISHLIFDYYLNSYIKNIMIKNKIKDTNKNFKKIKQKISSAYYEDKFNVKINKHKIKTSSYDMTLKARELTNKILKEIYLSSLGIKVYEISVSNYKKIKTNLFYKIIFKLLKNKKYSPSLAYRIKKVNKKIDYLNKEKNVWYLNGVLQVTDSFIELYNKAMYDSLDIITAINEEIFYKKKTKNSLTMQLNTFFDNEKVIRWKHY